MDESIIKFDPTTAELKNMVASTKDITAVDLKDKDQLAIVRKNRIALKTARVQISRVGKELRQEAVDFQGKVIAKEKELIAIIEPEEDRLEAIEKEAENLKIREDRLEKLPARKERLIAIHPGIEPATTDEELLEMDSNQFESYFNSYVAKHNEDLRKLEREEQALKEAEIKAEQDAKQEKLNVQQAELDKKEADLKAKEDEIKRAEQIKQAEEEAVKSERDRIEYEKKKAENDKKAQEAELKKKKDYIEFLKSYGWTNAKREDFKVEEEVDGYVLYQRLGKFKK